MEMGSQFSEDLSVQGPEVDPITGQPQEGVTPAKPRSKHLWI